MRWSTRVGLLLLAGTTPLLSQAPTAESRPFSFSIGIGPSHAFRGVDSRGIEGQAAVAHKLGKNFGLRLEGTGHWYGEQDMYPCMIQDAQRCYQSMRRVVSAGLLNVTYHATRFADKQGRTVPYMISGLGVYRSRRIATHYPDCQPSGACTDRATYRLEFRDSQLGWSGGLGLDFDLANVPGFMEMRLHYVYRNTPGGRPSNDYFLFPLSAGLRF